MGACTSMHHRASTTKVQMSCDLVNKPDHTSVIHPSPIKKLASFMDEQQVDVKPQPPRSQSPPTLSQYGSRDEAFFDSQAWLDSDYEDEFMSVNGEFTPSRGNTPVHHSLTKGTLRVNAGATVTDHNEPLGSSSQPSPTPTEKRRRLLDLFKESIRDNNNNDPNFEISEPINKDGQMGLEKDGLKPKNDTHVGSMSGCFKSLLSVRSTGKHKSPSPVIG